MLSLEFAGWFQCRLATGGDPYNEPRGRFGWTFAMPGEPDLDRIIRFQNPIAPRSHCPQVGVHVLNVSDNNGLVTNRPLLNGSVELIDNAVFEGRNGQISGDAEEPLIPFHIRIQKDNFFLIGRDPVDIANLIDLKRRQPMEQDFNSSEVGQVTGITNPVTYRQQRKMLLQTDLASETDPTKPVVLQKRISELGKGDIRTASLKFQLTWEFDLNGNNEWQDPNQLLGNSPSLVGWKTRFWMGGWDADALSAYVKGVLIIP